MREDNSEYGVSVVNHTLNLERDEQQWIAINNEYIGKGIIS